MPLAIGSNTLVLVLVFAVPAALAAFLPVRARWLVAVGVALAAIWCVAAVADEDPDDLGAPATALVALFLLALWCGGVAAGRLLRGRIGARS